MTLLNDERLLTPRVWMKRKTSNLDDRTMPEYHPQPKSQQEHKDNAMSQVRTATVIRSNQINVDMEELPRLARMSSVYDSDGSMTKASSPLSRNFT